MVFDNQKCTVIELIELRPYIQLDTELVISEIFLSW